MHSFKIYTNKIQSGYYFSSTITVLAFLFLLSLNACTVPLSYFDNTTYRNLTSLKVDTTMLVHSFDEISVKDNKEKINLVMIEFLKAYEYEKGKGKKNNETIVQMDKLIRLLKDDIANYREAGPGTLGKKYFQEAATILSQGFDIAIATENAKNREKH